MNRDVLPLKDEYGKEFYRCIDDVFRVVWWYHRNLGLVTEPEAVVSIFFIPDITCGIELLDIRTCNDHLKVAMVILVV